MSIFKREDEILNFGPRRPREHPKLTFRENILWPAWAYRVVAPRARDRHFDVFQRATLGLCKAGQQDFSSISRRLLIHHDLAAFILAHLSKCGYVDSTGLATDQGRRILEEDSFDDPEMVVGHVFQDPWKGTLWPRFVEQLYYCEHEYNEKGYPRLLLGTPGKPRKLNPFKVSPKGASMPSPPSPAEVIAAVAGHQKGVRHVAELSEREDEPGEAGHAISKSYLERMSFIHDEPTLVFLVTYLYLTDSSARVGDWYACDPFGFGASVRLHRRVEEVMQKVPGLDKVVERLVGRVAPDGLEKQQYQSVQPQTRAEQEVERRLSGRIRTHAAFKQIVAMEFAHQELVSLEEDRPAFKVHAAFNACRQCLEAVFGGIAKEHPFGEVWKHVYVSRSDPETGLRVVPQQDQAWLEATYKAAARAVGFAEPIPESLRCIRPKDIRLVVEGGDRRLRPLVMACLLLAQTQPSHPLRDVAVKSPGLLRDIDAIARQSDDSAPADGGRRTVSDVSTTVESTYKVLSILLGPPPSSTSSKIGAAYV